jgi:hypothetical protein
MANLTKSGAAKRMVLTTPPLSKELSSLLLSLLVLLLLLLLLLRTPDEVLASVVFAFPTILVVAFLFFSLPSSASEDVVAIQSGCEDGIRRNIGEEENFGAPLDVVVVATTCCAVCWSLLLRPLLVVAILKAFSFGSLETSSGEWKAA